MARLPAGFPIDTPDDELEKTLREMLEQVHAWSADFDRLLPELQLDLIASARAEIGRRERAKADRRARFIAFAALAVSVIALVASIIFATA